MRNPNLSPMPEFIHSFIHLVHKILLRICYVPGTGDTTEELIVPGFCPHGASSGRDRHHEWWREKMFSGKKKKKILASSVYKSGSIQTLRHLKCILLIIPIATSQNLGFGNTRPSRMGSVDMLPWLLVPSQDPLSGKKGQPPGLAGEETSWRKRGPFPTCFGGKLLHLRLGNLSTASWAALWNGVRDKLSFSESTS